MSTGELDYFSDLFGAGFSPAGSEFEFGDGFDRERVRVDPVDPHEYWPEGSVVARIVYADRPLIRELFGAYCSPEATQRLRTGAEEILRAHQFPTAQSGRVEWVWKGDSLFWAVDGTSDREESVGIILDNVPDKRRLEAYLLPTAPINWAILVYDFLRWGDALMSLPEEGSGLTPEKAWRKVSLHAFLHGVLLANYYARRRHEESVQAGHRSQRSVLSAGGAKRDQAQRWQATLKPHIERLFDANPTLSGPDVYKKLRARSDVSNPKSQGHPLRAFFRVEPDQYTTYPSENSVSRYANSLKKARQARAASSDEA
ncbi:hypothetical protein [Maricaulis sp.]|uniref:hypothetical protein n=1 Tax=Maricaulis sp. TaxID=1486257 RepID=UPI003A94921A